jgi:hypothetical protein
MFLAAALAASVLFISPPAAHAAHASPGYWMLTADGQVYAFGGAEQLGSPFSIPGRVKITPTPSGNGYWVLSAAGSVYNYGDAGYFGIAPSVPFDEDYTTMAATPTGKGYWLFTSKGRVFRFGDAQHFGDLAGTPLNGPVLDAVATPTGQGYYMVGSDGGVFTFGDAKFYGSTGNKKLNKPVMSLAPDPDGVGYWLVASDGGIFTFEAPFHGSTGNLRLNKPISGMVASPTGGGYLMVAEDGGVFTFGDVPFYGSLGNNPPAHPVVSIAAIGNPPPPPVYQSRTIFDTAGTGSTDSQPFQLVATTTTMQWHCGQASDYSAGCNFAVYEYDTGTILDYVSANPGQSGVLTLHPRVNGRHYIQIREFSINDDTSWNLSVGQDVCVQNCS